MHYRLTMNTWDNQASLLARFRSACIPELSSFAPDLLLVRTCSVPAGSSEFRVLRPDGRVVMHGRPNPQEMGHEAKGNIVSHTFALKAMRTASDRRHSVASHGSDLVDQEVRVYRATDGKRLASFRAGAPAPSHDGYSLSPDGTQLAILSGEQIKSIRFRPTDSNQSRSAAAHTYRFPVKVCAIGCNDRFPVDHGRFFSGVHEVLKEGAIVNHRATQIFSAGLPFGLPNCDFVPSSVVLRHDGMLNRDVSDTLLKVAHRVAAGSHQVAEQLIGLGNRTRRSIHKVGLHAIPLLRVACAILSRKRAKVKFLYALGAFLETCLGAVAIAALGNGAVILGSEVLTKLFSASPLQIEHHDGADNHQDNGNDNGDLGRGKILHVHDAVLLFLCLDTV
jgi:hypothetical protein